MKTFNLYVDDVRTPMVKVGAFEIPDSNWVIVRTAEDAMTLIETGVVNDLALDHDLGNGLSGYDIMKWIEESGNWPHGKITCHSANYTGRDAILFIVARNEKNRKEK